MPAVKLPFTYDAQSTVCPHCKTEYVIYAILRDSDGKQGETWSQVGGYCYMCSKPTDKQTEKIERIASGMDK